MNNVDVFVKIEPTKTTHQSSLRVLRNKRGGFFVGKMSSSPHKKWLSHFEKILAAAKPGTPISEPCFISLTFAFPHLKSVSNKNKASRTFKTTRPDLDNLEKSILDSLVRVGFIADDSLVCQKFSQKYFDEDFGIRICITSAEMTLDESGEPVILT
jgi:Holliday junction resolvase RusA-like endonuclease